MSKLKWTLPYLKKMLTESPRPKISDIARTAGVSRQRVFSILKGLNCSIVGGKLVYNER